MTAREQAEGMVEVAGVGQDRYVLRWSGCCVHLSAPDDWDGTDARRRIAVDVLARALGDQGGRPLYPEEEAAPHRVSTAGLAVILFCGWAWGFALGLAAHACLWGGGQ